MNTKLTINCTRRAVLCADMCKWTKYSDNCLFSKLGYVIAVLKRIPALYIDQRTFIVVDRFKLSKIYQNVKYKFN